MFSRFSVILVCLVLIFSVFVPTSRSQPSAKSPTETISIRAHEGTDLAFDVSPDGRSIVFDLLGQLWSVPALGGKARPITNAVRDIAEDLDPSFAPDGRRILFRGERNGRTGLWLLDLGSGRVRQLTQLSEPEGYDGNAAWSPDGRVVAFTHAVPPDGKGSRWRMGIMLIEVSSGNTRELSITGVQSSSLDEPVWVQDGKAILFVARTNRRDRGGRAWIVPISGGQANPVTDETVKVISPTFSPDGRQLAYLAPDGDGRTQVWVKESSGSTPVRLTNQKDVTLTRIRWMPDGRTLLYSADGRLWNIASSGAQPKEIPFTAELSITRPKSELPPARFPEPGRPQSAKGFMGLALSPDGGRIGMLALGKLWVIPVGQSPIAVADVPFEGTSLAWAPDGREIAFSAGVADHEDIFAVNLKTAKIRRVTALPGREAYPTYSPDGRSLAFIHIQDDGVLRVIDARAANVSAVTETKDLGSIGLTWTSPPQWSPESEGLLVCGGTDPGQLGRATFVTLSGERQVITHFPNAPIFLAWTPQHTITFVRHDRLWQAPFDKTGMRSDPKPIGTDAALYASSSNAGDLLFVSDGGLRLRSAGGQEQKIAWPLSYTTPFAEPMLIRNVRIIDGTGGPVSAPRDILIERGRIARIVPTGSLPVGSARLLDAGGRIIMPGLIDLHAHTYRPDLLPGFLYFGVTTIRDQGSSMAPLASYASNIAAGILPGPRVGYGGFQFYSDWSFDEEQGRGIEPEADPEHIKRSVALLAAFGAQHIKTRTFRRWDINARMIAEAHRYGMRATGHCSHLLPLIAAGMDAKEHIGICEERGNTHMYDDMIQLFKVAGIGVVPTISYLDLATRLSERPAYLDDDKDLAPFMPARDSFGWMFDLSATERQRWVEEARNAREGTLRLSRAGVNLGTGTDIWQIPNGVHMELEQMVAAGLTPLEAIHAGTGGASLILGADKDLGTIAVGKWADLIILDADPLADIRNTRRIWNVIQYGRLVDRPAILKVIRPR